MNDFAQNGKAHISVIIPTFNEERTLGPTLEALPRVKGTIEVIVVDGGSDDRTTEIARRHGAQVISSRRGRGTQLHAGAEAATSETLLFLHADTKTPPGFVDQICEVLSRDASVVGGNFEIRFDGQTRPAKFMTWLYPKLRKIGLYYGDSGIFVKASVYSDIGGFNPFPIFEDLDFVRRLKRRGRMVHLPFPVITSSRRFEGRSFAVSFARWSLLQGLFWLGVSPHTLVKLYAPTIRKAEKTSGTPSVTRQG